MLSQEFGRYLHIVKKWWAVIALLFVVTVGTMLAISFFTETLYEASTRVRVSAPPPQEVPLFSEFGRQALRDEINAARTSFSELLLEGDIATLTLRDLPEISMRPRELRDNITIESPRDSQLLIVNVLAPDPDEAALLANKLIQIGLQRYGELNALSTVGTRKFIEEQLDSLRGELETAEQALAQFRIDNKVGDLDRAIESQNDLIRSLKVQLDLSRAKGEADEAQALENIIFEREAELQNYLALSADYNNLSERAERLKATHDFLLERMSEAQIKENQILEVSYIQTITPATPPSRPVAAIDSRYLVFGGVVSIMAGLLLTFLLEYLDQMGILRPRETKPVHATDVVTVSDSG